MAKSLVRGLLAGTIATGVLTWFERFERGLLGRTPQYHAVSIADRLRRNLLRRHTSHATARRLGRNLKWVYGPVLGALYGLQADLLPQSPWSAGLQLGHEIFVFERTALPLTGATSSLRLWSPLERLLLRVHTAVFGL